MEPLHVNGSSGNRSGPPATNSAEIVQVNTANKLDPSSSSSTSELPSQDQFQFVTDTTSTSPQSCSQDHLQPGSHDQVSISEHGNDSTSNSHLGTQPGNNLGETHSYAFENMSAPPSSTSSPQNPFEFPSDATNMSAPPPSTSSPQNPFEFPSDATNMTPPGVNGPKNVHDQRSFEPLLNPPSLLAQQENSGTNNNLSTNHTGSNDMLGLNPSLSFSAYDSSQADPIQVIPSNVQTHPTNNTLDETHFSSSSEHLGPSSLLSSSASESCQNLGPLEIGSHNNTFPFTEQEHKSTASSNLRTDPVAVLGKAGGSNLDAKSGSRLFSRAAESSSQIAINASVNPASNSQTDTNAPLKVGLDSQLAAESSDDDIPISSMPKNEQTSDVGRTNSPAVGADRNLELDTKNASEVQNPPTQVMESPEDSDPSSEYRIPSHVFARNKSKTPGWSTASNESLFSIHMDNTSFSRELYWGKSGELYSPHAMNMSSPLIPPLTPTTQPPVQQQQGKSGELYSPNVMNISSPLIPLSTNQPPVQQQQGKSGELYGPHAMNISSPLIPLSTPTPTNQPPLQQQKGKQPPSPPSPPQQPPPTPSSLVHKLNDNSQPDDLNDGSRVIEAKGAETMREIIKENTENIGKGDLSFADGGRGTHRISHHSHHLSDGSTKSFMFPILTGDEKSASSKRGDRKARQQNSELQAPKESPKNAAASPKSTPKAAQRKWLPSCISCCWLPTKSY